MYNPVSFIMPSIVSAIKVKIYIKLFLLGWTFIDFNIFFNEFFVVVVFEFWGVLGTLSVIIDLLNLFSALYGSKEVAQNKALEILTFENKFLYQF